MGYTEGQVQALKDWCDLLGVSVSELSNRFEREHVLNATYSLPPASRHNPDLVLCALVVARNVLQASTRYETSWTADVTPGFRALVDKMIHDDGPDGLLTAVHAVDKELGLGRMGGAKR